MIFRAELRLQQVLLQHFEHQAPLVFCVVTSCHDHYSCWVSHPNICFGCSSLFYFPVLLALQISARVLTHRSSQLFDSRLHVGADHFRNEVFASSAGVSSHSQLYNFFEGRLEQR